MVLEFKDEEDKIYPWYVCPADPAEFPNAQKAIRNNYSELITKMPLDKLPDDVKEGDEFKLDTYIDGVEKSGSFFIGKTGLEDD